MQELEMTSKKDPAKKPSEPAKTPADPLAGQPVEVIIDVLAKMSGQINGLDGAELKRHVVRVATQLQDMTRDIEQKFAVEATRKEAAAEVERMVEMLVRTGASAGKALEQHRKPIAQAFQGADIQKLAEGMKLLATWMTNPTEQTEQDAKALLNELQTTMGPKVGYDPEQEERDRREAIAADVKKRMSEAMGTQDFKPKIKPFTPPPVVVVKKPDEKK
jgi:hypothetical protein